MLKKTSPGIGNSLRYFNRLQWFWLAIGVVLVLDAYAWVDSWLANPFMSALLMLCAMVLIGIPLELSRRLQRVKSQRDDALTQLSTAELQIRSYQQNKDLCQADQSMLLVQTLQNEIRHLNIKSSLLQAQAHHDSLTGLANRFLLGDRFHFAVERAKRNNKSFALLMLDINGFKGINDNHGHSVGDAVLLTMARRLVAGVRASDTVARLGGDEFVLIIESVDELQEIYQIGQKLMESLAEPIPLETGMVLEVGASVGLALFPDDGVSMDDLLHIADLAMYECKSTGLISLY